MYKWLTEEPPRVGSKWVLRGEENNPFTNNCTAIVEETKAGWVKYRWGWAIGKDEFWGDYLPIRRFRAIYKELKWL